MVHRVTKSQMFLAAFFVIDETWMQAKCLLTDKCIKWHACSAVSYTNRPTGLYHQVFCPLDFSGNNTGVGCHFLLQGILPTQGLNLCLLHYRFFFLFFICWALEKAEENVELHNKKNSAFIEGNTATWDNMNVYRRNYPKWNRQDTVQIHNATYMRNLK